MPSIIIKTADELAGSAMPASCWRQCLICWILLSFPA